MELAILIAKQIGSMFLMILTGVVLRKCNVVDANAGKSLSKIAVNVVLPCTIINAFQIDYSREVSTGLLFALGMAFLCNLVLTLLPYGLKHLKLTPIEQASFSYPNCGEILLPLVASVLSKEMQIYCCGFIIVQINWKRTSSWDDNEQHMNSLSQRRIFLCPKTSFRILFSQLLWLPSWFMEWLSTMWL